MVRTSIGISFQVWLTLISPNFSGSFQTVFPGISISIMPAQIGVWMSCTSPLTASYRYLEKAFSLHFLPPIGIRASALAVPLTHSTCPRLLLIHFIPLGYPLDLFAVIPRPVKASSDLHRLHPPVARTPLLIQVPAGMHLLPGCVIRIAPYASLSSLVYRSSLSLSYTGPLATNSGNISGPNNFQKASKNVPEIGANPYRMGIKRN